MKVLIIESVQELAEIMGNFIETSFQVQVVYACSVQQALEKLAQSEFQVVLSELSLEDGEFWPVFDFINNNFLTSSFILVTTSYWDDHPNIHGKNLDFLHKPFDSESFLKTVGKYLAPTTL